MTEREYRLLKALKFYATPSHWHESTKPGHGERSWHWEFRVADKFSGICGIHESTEHPSDVAATALRDWDLLPEDEQHEAG